MIWNDEFETLPREALESLQLKRLRRRLERVYATVPFYRERFQRAGVDPGHDQVPGRSAAVSLHSQAGYAGQLSLRAVRRSPGSDRADSCFLRDDRQTDGGRLHPPGYRHLVRADGPLLRRGRRSSRRCHSQRLRVRSFYRRARRPLRRREARGFRDSDVGGQHQEADHDHAGLRLHRADLHAFLQPLSRRGRRRGGGRYPGLQASGRHLRRRALERVDPPRNRGEAQHQGHRHLRPLRNPRSRGRQSNASKRRRGCTSGRIISFPKSSIPIPATCFRRASWASW